MAVLRDNYQIFFYIGCKEPSVVHVNYPYK